MLQLSVKPLRKLLVNMQGWYMTCDYNFSFAIATVISNTESTNLLCITHGHNICHLNT